MAFALTLPKRAGVATYPPGATFGPRQMRDYEFVWMVEGDAVYRHADRTVEAPAGSIVLCRPGAIDAFTWDPRRRTRHAYFHFEMRSRPPGLPAPMRWPLARRGEDGDILRPLFRQLLTWIDRGRSELVHRGLLLMIHAFVTGDYAAPDVPSARLPEPVEKALSFLRQTLEDEPGRPIELTELADAGCVTREHLCRLFTAATGRSPAQTVRLARLDRAAVLLAHSNYSVGQIADLCGFASPFHFSRRFSEAFGESPRALRLALQKGAMPPVPLLHDHDLLVP